LRGPEPTRGGPIRDPVVARQRPGTSAVGCVPVRRGWRIRTGIVEHRRTRCNGAAKALRKNAPENSF
jgi:hypothetical protein